MEIVVNHLTRMQPGFFCAAGLDRTLQHVRPAAGRHQRLSTWLLATNGGPFDIANIIDLGETSPAGEAPEIEDRLFDPAVCRLVRQADPAKFWTALRRSARPGLRDIFGDDLTRRGLRGCGVDVGSGIASLGCLIPAAPPRLFFNPDGKLRARVTDGELEVDLSVTDIRLYLGDLATPNRELVERVQRRIAAGVEVLLSVGLTRPFAAAPDLPPVHWLQLNNIHLADKPDWRLE